MNDLEKITDIVSRKTRALQRVDLKSPLRDDFVAFYEALVDNPMPAWQKEIVPTLLGDSVDRLLILAPPGHGKSTLLAVYAAWLIGHNRNIRILFVAHTPRFARIKTNYIGALLQHPVFVRIFGEAVPPTSAPERWNDDQKFVLGRTKIMPDPTITTVGISGSILGYRADIIIGDDIVTLQNSATPHMRKTIISKFNTEVMSRLDPGGRVIVIGSSIFDNDLYGMLRNDNRYHVIEKAATPQQPLWPERVSAEDLADIYESAPTIAAAMYGQKPMLSQNMAFKQEWLRYYTAIPNVKGITHMAVDSTSTATSDSDYFVIMVGTYVGGYVYVRYMSYRRDLKSARDRKELVYDVYRRFNPSLVVVENVGGQQHFLDDLKDTYPGMPIVPTDPKTHNNIPKDIRLLRLIDYFKAGLIYLPGVAKGGNVVPDMMIDPLIREYSQYPASEHDDALDALEMLVSSLRSGYVPPATGSTIHDKKTSTPRKRGRRPRRIYLRNRSKL